MRGVSETQGDVRERNLRSTIHVSVPAMITHLENLTPQSLYLELPSISCHHHQLYYYLVQSKKTTQKNPATMVPVDERRQHYPATRASTRFFSWATTMPTATVATAMGHRHWHWSNGTLPMTCHPSIQMFVPWR